MTYPDGSSARIITSAGFAGMYQGRGIALVGSLLDNGDEIISTPQQHGYMVTREGIQPGADFLVSTPVLVPHTF